MLRNTLGTSPPPYIRKERCLQPQVLLCLAETSLVGVIKLCSKEHSRYKQIIPPSTGSSPLLFFGPPPFFIGLEEDPANDIDNGEDGSFLDNPGG